MRLRTLEILQRLVRVARDGHYGYDAAAHDVQDATLRVELARHAVRRKHFAEQLRAEADRLGRTLDDDGSIEGALHRRWIDVRSGGSSGDAHVLREIERGEHAAIDAYEKALAEDPSPRVRELLQAHLASVREVRDRIVELRRELERTR